VVRGGGLIVKTLVGKVILERSLMKSINVKKWSVTVAGNRYLVTRSRLTKREDSEDLGVGRYCGKGGGGEASHQKSSRRVKAMLTCGR